ncbi:hypothetical protein CHARACLAT_009231 [Characodon lateralis]|uniref:Uncharacterized protein n=1 Tax=Characodon lateralis TaxID=208331 RepID=A0ABU7CWQ8_9TELE|nr:hypothetical protein [Characodon lateralis]
MRQHQLEGRKWCDGSLTLTTGRALTLLCWKHGSHDGEGKKLMEFCIFCHNVETTYNSRKRHLSGGHCLKQQPPKRYSAISLLSTTALSELMREVCLTSFEFCRLSFLTDIPPRVLPCHWRSEYFQPRCLV